MLLLDTTRSIKLTTEAGVTTAVEFFASSITDDGSSLAYSPSDGQANGTTDVDVIAAPGSGTKLVKSIMVMNRDTVARVITIKLVSGANTRELFVATVQPGRMVEYAEGTGWTSKDAHGRLELPGTSGPADSVQYNNGGSFAGADYVAIHGGDLLLKKNTVNVTTPPADTVKLYARSGARYLAAIKGPGGQDTSLQPHLGGNRVGRWLPPGNATTAPLADGIAAPTATGTATARNVATTTLASAMRRLGYVSAATAGSLAGPRMAAAQFFRGDGTAKGGFDLRVRFVPSDAATVAGARMFVGLAAATAAPTNVDPSTLVNIIGIGEDTGDTNLSIMHNDGAGVATEIALGANFPANGLSADAYGLELFCPSGGGDVRYRVERLNTAHVAEGVLSTDLPTATTLLAIQMWRSNNATALAVGIDLCGLYIETDY